MTNLSLRNVLGLIILLTLCDSVHAGDATLISFGSTWQYLDDGSDQGTLWREAAFDDSGWFEGPAQLGYGEDDEVTVVDFGGDPANRFVTTYLRHSFNVENADDFPSLEVELLRDDGAVVYLNGVEILRSNMPAGTINSTTFAASSVAGSNEVSYFSTVVPSAGQLVNGLNVVAVEVHQRNAGSSDVSFDLRLRGVTADLLIPDGADWKFLDDGTNQGTAWTATDFADTTWPSGAAQLGYGDGDEATTIGFGGNTNDKFITTYFRHHFAVTDPGTIRALQLEMVRDDGAAVYLNGTLVYATNLPLQFGYLTLSLEGISSSQEDTFYSTCIPTSLLIDGDNVLAVEVHQESATSSDVSFDARLKAFRDTDCLVRGPYLQRVTSDSAVVQWRTCGATDSQVAYGLAPGALDSIVSNSILTTDHAVVLNGLEPGTRFYYAVGSSKNTLAGDDDAHFIDTVDDTNRTLRIWAIGDSGTANSEAGGVINAYQQMTPDTPTNVWLMLGDNAYDDGTDEEYQESVFEVYPNLLRNTAVWPTLGNHDAHNADSPTESGPYYDIFTLPSAGEAGGMPSGTEAYYSFDSGHVHFICLDSQDTNNDVDGAMMTWLAEDLADTTADWIIAFCHHPPYTKGSHDSDVESRLIDMRQNALPILEAGGVDLVLTGHSHSYERSFLLAGHYGHSSELVPEMILDPGSGNPDNDGPYAKPVMTADAGTVYCVAGSSGKISDGTLDHPAMFIGIAELGSMVLDVDGLVLDATFLDDQSIARDRFQITKTCDGDVVQDGTVDVSDLLAVLAAWGPCEDCSQDINQDDLVDIVDILALLGAWNSCF